MPGLWIGIWPGKPIPTVVWVAHCSYRRQAQATTPCATSSQTVNPAATVDVTPVMQSLIAMLTERPKLLTRGKTFAQENALSGATPAKVRHTHSAFNNICTSMMKALLDDNNGFANIIMKTNGANLLKTQEEQAQETSVAAGEVVRVVATSIWATFPHHLVMFARTMYQTFPPVEGSPDWGAICARLDLRLAGVSGVWSSYSEFEEFLQLRSTYMRCLLLTITESLAQLSSDHKSDDLGDLAMRLKKYFDNAVSFLNTCASEVLDHSNIPTATHLVNYM
jgi:hypothetical protein